MNDHSPTRRVLLGAGLGAAAGLLADVGPADAAPKRRVVVWSEGTAPKNVYPEDINVAIAQGLKPLKDWDVLIAGFGDPEHGLSEEMLNKTDVLIWWGHQRHGQVNQEVVDRVVRRVREGGMGYIPTHSSHYARPFQKLLGTKCGWPGGVAADGSQCKVVVKEPRHPVARGIKEFVIPRTERYGEPFEVPAPDTVVFDGIYTLPNGQTEKSRQGLIWTVGKGKVFYFQPGHETYPIYFQEEVRQVFRNAVVWAAPRR